MPDPDADFPIDYVLDGQQRITSIFGVFQTELKSVNLDGWKDIYFDFSLENNVQETQFFALENDQVDKNRHFPLRAIFNTTEYRKLTRGFDDRLANKIDQMQAVFKEAKIPYQSFRTEEKEKVAIIFERINRQGVPLDTLQLLSAWTWSEEFELQAQFDDLIEEIQNYGFSDLGGDISLLLRCSAAILNKSPRPESLVSLNGSEVRKRFNEVINGIKGALDFLKSELNIEAIDNLPYQACLVPLSVFFAVEGNKEVHYNNSQRDILLTWLWKSFFSKRYSAGLLRNLTTDIHEIINLKNNQISKLSSLSVSVAEDFYTRNNFLISSVNTKTFILQWLCCTNLSVKAFSAI
ncbi:DUF262 domain-containing protein [Acinetobacter courvalinii]|uniref:GmrSD restriction endonuclease domain-containing protein n=1 Tax=Acinetobacter courvalinii TaxID=280147 RepID=UPI0039C9355B